ncbi:hypothetical protein RvY_12870 [Ramazzottius varieornatus]|uniref:Fucosyltransferase n=1 Tax=Ramazzottius varieornatus TaxID=947166 RepID=A0A1D1VMY7_RAMVA|nr:hypothetical protein RvY_12870 [Ramazzottius varieornatus]
MTFTYLLDSDVLGHYAYSVPLQTEPTNFAAGKKKLVAWFVSNCHTQSKREDVVKELQKYIQIDVYGKCGPLKCPRTSEASCNAMLRTDYKFYLAFENSICEDYVTEKFTNALANFVVPIAFNGANMTIFPSNSFINLEDYSSTEELAEYLKYLDKNDTAYNALMQWRYNSTLISSSGRFSPARGSWCQLCERLHDPGYRSTPYKDASQWFMNRGKCRSLQRPVRSSGSSDKVLRSP